MPPTPFPPDDSFVHWTDGPPIVVLSSCDEGGRVSPPHRHARGQLFASVRGLLTAGVDDAVLVVPSVHAVWLPPQCTHWARSHGPFEGWSAYLAPDDCHGLPATACTVRLSGLLREAVLRAAQWPPQRAALPPARERIARIIVDELRTLPVEPLGLPMPRDPRLQRIATALVHDPSSERGLDDWAAFGGVSARTLSRRFVAETGFTFTAWRQRTRLLRALEMLASNVPVNAIALELGFATASAFIAVFRHQYGTTPAAYRTRLLSPAA